MTTYIIQILDVPDALRAQIPACVVPASHKVPDMRAQRNGNGHKAQKIRALYDYEKNYIRGYFTRLDGCIHGDACVEILESLKHMCSVHDQPSVFQIVGFVSLLHNYIASGDPRAPTIKNISTYEAFLSRNRHMTRRHARYWDPAMVSKRLNLSGSY